MSHPSKVKGSSFERQVLAYLQQTFPTAHREPSGAALDRGDIFGIPDVTIECKNMARLADAVSSAVDEAAVEAVNGGTRWAIGVVKRPRRGDPADAYAVMPLAQLVDMLEVLDARRGSAA